MRRERTPTYLTTGKLAATGSSAAPALILATYVVILDTGHTVAARSFSTIGGMHDRAAP